MGYVIMWTTDGKMMKHRQGAGLAYLIWLLITTSLPAQDASEIIRKMDQVMRGESSYAEMTMKIERPRYDREVSMKSWAKGDDFSLILITGPARDKGTTYLKRKSEIWNYVPNIDRTIKMPPSMMSQSWMGSDFTNDDLVRESSTVDDYKHKILRDEIYLGMETWVLELVPHPDTPVVWGKVIVWVLKEDFLQVRSEQFDQQNELASTIEFDEIEMMGGRKIPTKLTMTPADKPDHRTILKYSELEFNIDIEESFFSKSNMKRVR